MFLSRLRLRIEGSQRFFFVPCFFWLSFTCTGTFPRQDNSFAFLWSPPSLYSIKSLPPWVRRPGVDSSLGQQREPLLARPGELAGHPEDRQGRKPEPLLFEVCSLSLPLEVRRVVGVLPSFLLRSSRLSPHDLATFPPTICARLGIEGKKAKKRPSSRKYKNQNV